ncbi:hypothetical protein C7H84_33960 [Burkholderia sp. Nafp2/4-1b]|uniref:acyl-CoA thioesterase n=1 Tax=Burkholderia sp. Nafp2/4-1b TaxID=2116686 RepID=UPI000EF91AB1|nr:thioesterase family protein [Burkholderia sp. Nafp2/4-1b]RKT98984.1 hypothetical protein C7H84_33960 [Burkholderia sp. Nafp2/4-1b]
MKRLLRPFERHWGSRMQRDLTGYSSCEIPTYRRRIYHADTDAGGVVHHSRYLVFLEEARTEWMSGICHEDVAEFQRGVKVMVVTSAKQRFLKPIRFNQVAEISSRIAELGRAKLTIVYSITVGGKCCHEAEIRFACMDIGAQCICSVPDSIRNWVL